MSTFNLMTESRQRTNAPTPRRHSFLNDGPSDAAMSFIQSTSIVLIVALAFIASIKL